MQTDNPGATPRDRQLRWPSWTALTLLALTRLVWAAASWAGAAQADNTSLAASPPVPQQSAAKPPADRAAEPVAGQTWVRQPLSVQLPAAPEPFATWIDVGNVSFDFYDPQQESFQFAGETKFSFHYTFRCQTQWQLISGAANAKAETDQRDADQPASGRSAGRRKAAARTGVRKNAATAPQRPPRPTAMEVRMVYDEVKLSISHRIRLPIALAGPTFFDHPLVQHEFDHVAISADSKLQDRLKRMLTQRNTVITVPIEAEPPEDALPPAAATQQDSVTQQDSENQQNAALTPAATRLSDHQRQHYADIANAAVRRESDRVFQDFIDAVAIRHRELDRVTAHGTRPLDPDQWSPSIE